MRPALTFESIEKLIVRNPHMVCTAASYSAVLAIFINLNSLRSPLIGLGASIIYFAIDSIFLAHAFFHRESPFLRLALGVLLLIMLLGSLGWLVMIIYNLDVLEFTLVLAIASTVSSALNRRNSRKDVVVD